MGCAAGKPAQEIEPTAHAAPKEDDTSEKPFADDGPVVAQPAPDESTEEAPRQRRGRSRSVAKLEEIALKREQDHENAFDPSADQVGPAAVAVEDSPTGSQTSPPRSSRHRRLSSIYNDFSAQMSEFWRIKDDSETESQEVQIRKMFTNLDINDSGYITREALEEGFRRMGLTSSSTQIKTMFDLADTSMTGKLAFPEFFKFFKSMASLDTIHAEEADELTALGKTIVPVRRRGYSVSVRFLRSFAVKPFGFLPRRVKSIAICPNRPLVAAVDRDDHIAHIYDLDSRIEVRRLIGHQDSMLSIVFSPDKKTIATASRDNTLIIWDCTVGHELCSCRHPGVVTACDFSYDGKYIYTGCQDNLVRKLVTSKGKCHRLMERMPQPQLGVIVALAAQQQQDKKILMSRSCDKCAHVLDGDRLTLQASLLGHSGMVWHCGFNHDDSLMVTQCDKFIKLWGAHDNLLRFSIAAATMSGPKKPPARRPRLWTTVAFGPQDFASIIIAAANDSMLYVLRIDTGDVLVAIEAKSSVYALAVGVQRSNVLFGDDVGNMFELLLH